MPIHQEAFKQELLKADQSIPWFYTDGLLDPTFVESTGLDAALFTGFSGTAPGSEENTASTQFAERYIGATGGEFTLFAPQSYDAAWLVILAAQASDGTTAGIQAAMVGVSKGGEKCIAEQCLGLLLQDPATDIDYVGASGEIDFKDGSGDPGTSLYQVWSFTCRWRHPAGSARERSIRHQVATRHCNNQEGARIGPLPCVRVHGHLPPRYRSPIFGSCNSSMPVPV